MVERVTRKNENLESELPLTISAQYGLIDQNEFFDKRIASRDVSGYYLLKKGEFAYNKSTSSDAPWGAVKRLDRYEMGVLSTLYIVFALKEDGNIDSDFLVSYYDTDCWHKGVQAIAAEGARNHGLLNITPADYFETVLTVPSDVKEQHQIGTFFAKLDTLITLHQRECFSFDFSGESAKTAQKTISWEQRKLGDIADVTKLAGFEFTEHIVYSDKGNIIALRGLNVKNGQLVLDDVKYIDGSNFNKLGRSKLYVNDVLFTYVGTVGELAIIPENERFYLAPNVSRIRFKSDYDARFMIQEMGSKSFYDHMIFPLIATSSQPALSMENIRKFVVAVPSNNIEQQQIGAFFANLDYLITLHQHKPNKKGHDVLSVMPFKGNQRKPHYLCT